MLFLAVCDQAPSGAFLFAVKPQEIGTRFGMRFPYCFYKLFILNDLLLCLAPQVGLEPTTLRLTAECSTIELLRSKMAWPLT